jgi:hypothetical protein
MLKNYVKTAIDRKTIAKLFSIYNWRPRNYLIAIDLRFVGCSVCKKFIVISQRFEMSVLHRSQDRLKLCENQYSSIDS